MKSSATRHLLLPFLLSIPLGSCSKKSEVAPLPPRPVITVAVPEASATINRQFSGQIQMAEGASLAFESGGRVIEVAAREGEKYKKGDVLASVDDQTYRNNVNSAQASLTNAEQELRRVRTLYATGNASKSDLDRAISNEASSRSSYENAKKSLDDTVLQMPYDGVIGTVDIEAQQVVSAGQQVMTIQGESGKEFEIGIPAENIPNIATGMKAKITLTDYPEIDFPATISEISADVSTNGTYSVTLQLGGDANKNENIRAGMDGETSLELPNPRGGAIRIPSECVVGGAGDATYVWIVEPPESGNEIAVHRRDVKTGGLGGDGTIEILDGLSPGEHVVSRGVHSLDEGAIVLFTN